MDAVSGKLGQWRLREWNDFLDLQRFKPPTQQSLQPRVVTNIQYYAINYLVIALVVLTVVVLFRPLILVVIAAEAALVGYLYTARASDGMLVLPSALAGVAGRRTVPRIAVVGASAAVSLLLMLIFGGIVLLLGYIVAAGSILLHAAFRQRSTKSKLTTYIGDATNHSELRGSFLSTAAEAVMADVEDLESAPMAAREELEEHRARYHELRDHLREKYADHRAGPHEGDDNVD